MQQCIYRLPSAEEQKVINARARPTLKTYPVMDRTPVIVGEFGVVLNPNTHGVWEGGGHSPEMMLLSWQLTVSIDFSPFTEISTSPSFAEA